MCLLDFVLQDLTEERQQLEELNEERDTLEASLQEKCEEVTFIYLILCF